MLVIGDDPRAPHCPHAELTEFVRNTGVQAHGQGFGVHLKVTASKQACICYMRFRHNRWRLNNVAGAWSNTRRDCPYCEAAIEDRTHVVFECPKYSSIRTAHPTLFVDAPMQNLACWLSQKDQMQIVACINSFHDMRFAS